MFLWSGCLTQKLTQGKFNDISSQKFTETNFIVLSVSQGVVSAQNWPYQNYVKKTRVGVSCPCTTQLNTVTPTNVCDRDQS